MIGTSWRAIMRNEYKNSKRGKSRYFRNSNKIMIKWKKKKGSGTIMPCAWTKDEKESAWRDVSSAVDFQKHRSFKKVYESS